MSSPLLSVLDLSPVPSGASASTALRNTIDLARHVEMLGFTRHWLAEHHNAAALACSAPEIMIGQVAAATRTLRVGSGGIMLPNHAPLKVAETFRVLAALFPDRIDLGIGRAAGTDKRTALALRRSAELLGEEAFPSQVSELVDWLEPREPSSEGASPAFGPIKAVPTGVVTPPIFVLGSSEQSATFAGENGFGYAFAHHMNPDGTAVALRAYRAAFRASTRATSRVVPHAIVALPVVCGESDAHAEALESGSVLQSLRFGRGERDQPLPSVEEANAYVFDADERSLVASMRARGVVGDRARVGDGLRRLAEDAGADELMVIANVHDHVERKRVYERIARALES